MCSIVIVWRVLAAPPAPPPPPATAPVPHTSQLIVPCRYSASADASIRFWEINSESGEAHVVAVAQGHTDDVTALLIYGRLLLSCSNDGSVRLWDKSTADALRLRSGVNDVALWLHVLYVPLIGLVCVCCVLRNHCFLQMHPCLFIQAAVSPFPYYPKPLLIHASPPKPIDSYTLPFLPL